MCVVVSTRGRRPKGVAQSCTLLYRRFVICEAADSPGVVGNSAGLPIANRRYEGLRLKKALLQRQASGAAHKRALTGLFTT